MATVRETTRLHHKTVSNHQRHTKRKSRSSARRSKVTHTKVDPRVWKAALSLAGHDRSRLKILSSTEVVVLNPSMGETAQ